jgi:hypothetical protein
MNSIFDACCERGGLCTGCLGELVLAGSKFCAEGWPIPVKRPMPEREGNRREKNRATAKRVGSVHAWMGVFEDLCQRRGMLLAEVARYLHVLLCTDQTSLDLVLQLRTGILALSSFPHSKFNVIQYTNALRTVLTRRWLE